MNERNKKLIAALTQDLNRAYYAGNDSAVAVIAAQLAEARKPANTCADCGAALTQTGACSVPCGR